MKMKMLFVVPANDGEALEIARLLRANGVEPLVTAQGWGASWENLEQDLRLQVLEAIANGRRVYGVELKGSAPYGAENIDHHSYEGDDRWNPKSSIEQVADLLGVELTPYQRLVAANDVGFIPGIEAAYASLSAEEKAEIGPLETAIQVVRANDRAAQGISAEEEGVAEVACAKAEVFADGDLTVVRMAHSKCATVTDRLYGQYRNLLVLSEDGESNFFGEASVCLALQKKFGGWTGGALDQGTGFWGGYADQEQVRLEAEKLLG